MDAVAKALWFIESNGDRQIELDDVAKAAGVSRFHLTRMFGQSLGRSVIAHLRLRRLAKAAAALAGGAPDILSVALDAGYGSHEAFTRAFRESFGVTPEQWRSLPESSTILPLEPILMTQNQAIALSKPEFIDAEPMLFVGNSRRYRYDAMDAIPAQWQSFNQIAGEIANTIPPNYSVFATMPTPRAWTTFAPVRSGIFRTLIPVWCAFALPRIDMRSFGIPDILPKYARLFGLLWVIGCPIPV